MEKIAFERPELSSVDRLKQALKKTISDEKYFRRVFLACEEIFTNIVFYSGASLLTVTIEEDDGSPDSKTIIITFTDDGVLFDPTVAREMKDFEELDTGGMGIAMAKTIAREIVYERSEDKNILKTVFCYE